MTFDKINLDFIFHIASLRFLSAKIQCFNFLKKFHFNCQNRVSVHREKITSYPNFDFVAVYIYKHNNRELCSRVNLILRSTLLISSRKKGSLRDGFAKTFREKKNFQKFFHFLAFHSQKQNARIFISFIKFCVYSCFAKTKQKFWCVKLSHIFCKINFCEEMLNFTKKL